MEYRVLSSRGWVTRNKTKGSIKTKSLKGGVKVLSSRGWARVKTRGEYRFMKLMKGRV